MQPYTNLKLICSEGFKAAGENKVIALLDNGRNVSHAIADLMNALWGELIEAGECNPLVKSIITTQLPFGVMPQEPFTQDCFVMQGCESYYIDDLAWDIETMLKFELEYEDGEQDGST